MMPTWKSTVAAAALVMLAGTAALAADPPEDKTKKDEPSTASKARDQANRIGDDIGKNVGQGVGATIEGFKKRFNTNKPDDGKR